MFVSAPGDRAGGFLVTHIHKFQELIMKIATLDSAALTKALSLRDLSDPGQGKHAMQLLVEDIHQSLERQWRCQRLVYRGSPVVTVQDNYDNLGYPEEGIVRDAKYSRYITPDMMLRAHTSAMIPGLLRSLVLSPPEDLLLVCPGIVYRRDSIDRIHTGEPHHLDLWRLTARKLEQDDLLNMIDTVIKAALPDYQYRTVSSLHPYTEGGLQIDVLVDGNNWIEVGECGMASPAVLKNAGLDCQGLAMGMGLDRLLMIRKSITDIRLLRSDDPRVQQQMLDLATYNPVSNQPTIVRDLSIAVHSETTAEELGDRVRETVEEDALKIECIEIVDEVAYDKLPAQAHKRMGMSPGQKNVLLRLVIRDPVKTLTSEEANLLRNSVYLALHEGECTEIA